VLLVARIKEHDIPLSVWRDLLQHGDHEIAVRVKQADAEPATNIGQQHVLNQGRLAYTSFSNGPNVTPSVWK